MTTWYEITREQALSLELKPGMVVKTDDGSQYLIGHANSGRGGCGCCTEFESREVVAWRWAPGFPEFEQELEASDGQLD